MHVMKSIAIVCILTVSRRTDLEKELETGDTVFVSAPAKVAVTVPTV